MKSVVPSRTSAPDPIKSWTAMRRSLDPTRKTHWRQAPRGIELVIGDRAVADETGDPVSARGTVVELCVRDEARGQAF